MSSILSSVAVIVGAACADAGLSRTYWFDTSGWPTYFSSSWSYIFSSAAFWGGFLWWRIHSSCTFSMPFLTDFMCFSRSIRACCFAISSCWGLYLCASARLVVVAAAREPWALMTPALMSISRYSCLSCADKGRRPSWRVAHSACTLSSLALREASLASLDLREEVLSAWATAAFLPCLASHRAFHWFVTSSALILSLPTILVMSALYSLASSALLGRSCSWLWRHTFLKWSYLAAALGCMSR
mmetsp:Transcript_39483/g.104884  ORF Transcript_39483/g.104884 Transcript_39483/m.104884 type:complete len:243 (-) Transcript_39483:1001-1729(-)